MTNQWHRICDVGVIPAKGMLPFEVGGHRIVLCRSAEGLFAVDDLCPHATAYLHEGRLKGTVLTCPMHGARFDIRDGRPLRGPATNALVSYPVREVGGQVEVLLDARSSDLPA